MSNFQTNLEGIRPEMLNHFCVGWRYPLSGEELFAVLKNSYHFVLAIDGGQVVGFVNCLSDGSQFAFIPMLEVLPSHQKQGIGSELLQRMFRHLEDIPNIDLTCDQDMQPYYQRFGMLRSHGMVFRKHLAAQVPPQARGGVSQ
jgi:ribosomal protein S18 acetylase RimI-like enzyme